MIIHFLLFCKLVALELHSWNISSHLSPFSSIVWMDETLTNIQLCTLKQFETEEK